MLLRSVARGVTVVQDAHTLILENDRVLVGVCLSSILSVRAWSCEKNKKNAGDVSDHHHSLR